METITTFLMGLGGLWVSLNLLLGIVELARIRTIRRPKRQTFTYIRLVEDQYQTVFAPAVGALISGLLVSIAASFFYEGFNEQQESWKWLAGVGAFILGAIALAVTLGSALKNVGEPLELARDPFSICAAADESAAAPRNGGLDPEALTGQLDEWNKYISVRSMNIAANVFSHRLDEKLALAAETRTFWRSAFLSFGIYCAALLRFPFRFVWPALGFLLFVVGVVGFAIGPAELPFLTSWRPWATVAVLVMIGAIPTLFYGLLRGNRARMWHRIYLVALEDARQAISKARVAHAAVAAEEALLQRVLGMADKFFQQDHTAQAEPARIILRFGRFSVFKK